MKRPDLKLMLRGPLLVKLIIAPLPHGCSRKPIAQPESERNREFLFCRSEVCRNDLVGTDGLCPPIGHSPAILGEKPNDERCHLPHGQRCFARSPQRTRLVPQRAKVLPIATAAATVLSLRAWHAWKRPAQHFFGGDGDQVAVTRKLPHREQTLENRAPTLRLLLGHDLETIRRGGPSVSWSTTPTTSWPARADASNDGMGGQDRGVRLRRVSAGDEPDHRTEF